LLLFLQKKKVFLEHVRIVKTDKSRRVVVIGRPNVGKSTLFNRLVGRRVALIADLPGVTRDAQEAPARLRGRDVILVDTAGLEEAAPETLAGRMRAGAETAVAGADLVLLVVDARAGITPADAHFAAWLRRQGRPVLVVANKAEGRSGGAEALEAYRLGLGAPIAVSAEHGEGIADLMGHIAEALPDDAEEKDGEAGDPSSALPLRLAILGRPNAGKSTLINRLLGAERQLTGPEPGITRDAIRIPLLDAAGAIELIDTAGLRRRARIEAPVEKLAAAAALGFDPIAAAAALAGFAGLAGRGARTRLSLPQGEITLLDESYNASPASVRAALAVLGMQAGRRLAVLGDMRELGAAGPAEHVALARDIAGNADQVFTAGPLMAGLFAAIPAALRGAHADSAAALAPLVLASLQEGDVVLVKGSFGSRMSLVIDAILREAR
jgi:small GTP-binding protein